MSTIRTPIGSVAIIPKDTWNIEQTYKRLNFVNYNNNGYIAKKDVPANIEITNTEYWMLAVNSITGPQGVQGNTGPTGPTGSITYATFEVSLTTGQLIMRQADYYDGPNFQLTENGHLEVII